MHNTTEDLSLSRQEKNYISLEVQESQEKPKRTRWAITKEAAKRLKQHLQQKIKTQQIKEHYQNLVEKIIKMPEPQLVTIMQDTQNSLFKSL